MIGLLLTALLCQDPASAAEAPLRVMSFNLRYGTAQDGEHSWEHRRPLVAQVLHAFDPDVLGVQEALRFQRDEVQGMLPGHGVVGQGRDGGDRGEFASVYFRKERLELLEHEDFWLSPTPDVVASVGWDAALTRMCTRARFRDRRTGRTFVVFNTHFDHRGAQARAESGRLIAARVQAEAPEPVLVLGDLNEGEDSPPLEHLRGAGLRDAFRVAYPEATPAGTFHGFQGRDGGPKIDYVLITGQWSVLEAAIDRTTAGQRFPSDHYPVTAILRLPGT